MLIQWNWLFLGKLRINIRIPLKHVLNNKPFTISRFIGVLLPTIPIVIYKQEPIFPEGKRLILLLRCFVGTSGLVLSFYAFRHMPLADASVIIFSTPVFVALFARLFLREPCNLFNVFTIILSLIGIVFITRPFTIFGDSVPSLVDEEIDFDKDYNAWGPVAAFASTMFGANAYVTLRALKGLHFSVIMMNFGAFALIYTTCVTWSIGAFCWPNCDSDRWMVAVLGLFSFLGQVLLTISLQLEQAGPVAIARSADIVFAFIWQILFFNEVPNSYSIIGALLVTSSVILTGVKKWTQTLPRDSMIRQHLRVIMFE